MIYLIGITFNKSIDWLKKYEPIKDKIEDIKTATLFKKKKSTFEPDFCANKLPDNPWIVQPLSLIHISEPTRPY